MKMIVNRISDCYFWVAFFGGSRGCRYDIRWGLLLGCVLLVFVIRPSCLKITLLFCCEPSLKVGDCTLVVFVLFPVFKLCLDISYSVQRAICFAVPLVFQDCLSFEHMLFLIFVSRWCWLNSFALVFGIPGRDRFHGWRHLCRNFFRQTGWFLSSSICPHR